jgi:peroxiredoxin
VEKAKSIAEPAEQIKYIEKQLKKEITDLQFDELSKLQVDAYLALKDFNGLVGLVRRVANRGTKNAELLNKIAWELAEAEKNLDVALMASAKAVDWTRSAGDEKRPEDISPAGWEQRLKWKLSAYLDTHGWILYLQEKYAEAEADFEEAVKLDQENAELLLHSMQNKLKLGKAEEAFNQAIMAKIYGAETEADSLAKVAYTAWKNTAEGYEQTAKMMYENMRKSQIAELMKEKLELEAPLFSLKDIKGYTVNLADYKGKIVFVNFWATWCPSCQQELPVFQTTCDKYKDQGVEFLAISTDKDTSKVIPFISEKGYKFTVLYDQGMKKAYDVAGIPTLFILDKEGKIRYKHIGYRPDLDEIWEKQIAELQKSAKVKSK